MSLLEMRDRVKRQVIQAAQDDPQIVGVIDYGSTGHGGGDVWSDLDVMLFVRDAELEAFEAGWQAWAAQFGPLLLAYVGGIGHPWAVYDAQPLPLRVDFDVRPASDVDDLAALPLAPASVEAMVWYDGTDGVLSACIAEIVGRSLAPTNLRATFDRVCGDFWTYQLRTAVRLLRGEQWAARYDFNAILMGNLLALPRLEAGAVERWRGADPSLGIALAIAPGRLAQLERCIPGASAEELRCAMGEAARAGFEACEALSAQHGWDWPRRLAERVRALLAC